MKQNLALLFFVILKFAINYGLIGSEYELHRDEFLHLDQANHLAFGYLSVPPLTSWTALLIQFFGNAEFWVKFFPCLYGAMTIVFVWKMAQALGAGWFALVLSAVCVLFSALLRINLLFQPNSFEVMAWTFTAFCFAKQQTSNKPWLIWAGIALGLGFLNKYSIAFLAIGLFLGLIASAQRKVLTHRDFWIGIGLAFLISLPNLIWQGANGFPVIHHMQLLKESQLVHVSASDFFKEQLLFFFGAIPVLIAGLLGIAFNPVLKPYRFMLWGFGFTLVLFVLLNAKGYYAISIYPIFFAFGAVVLEKRLTSAAGIVLRGACIAFPIGFMVLILPFAFPVDPPEVISQRVKSHGNLHLARWEDGKDHGLPQDFADMLGWKELAAKAGIAYRSLPAGERTVILCDNYGQAGAINYYFEAGRAVTMSADYIGWLDLSRPIDNVILVKETSDRDPFRTWEKDFFESVEKAGEVEQEFAREKGTSIFILKKANVNVNEVLEKKAQSERQQWGRG